MITRAWNRFWWAADSPFNLAAARVVISGHALWIVLSRDYSGASALPEVFWTGVRATTRWRYLIFPGHPSIEAGVQVVAVIALFCVLLGWRAQLAAGIAALALYHLAPLETIIWTASPFERGLEVSVLALVVLAVSPCTDVWSLDRRGAPREHGVAPDLERWPLLLIQLFVAQIYLFSGYSKLYLAGLDWITAENLSRWLLLFDQQTQIQPFTGLGPWVASRPFLSWSTAAAAVALDLGFVSVLFWPRLRRLFVPAALVFHVGIAMIMGILFLNAPQLLVFVNWDWLRGRIRAAARPAVTLASAA